MTALQPTLQTLNISYQDDLPVGSAPLSALNQTSTHSTAHYRHPFHDYPTTSPPPTPHGTYAGPNTFPRSQSIQHPVPATTGHGANGPHSRQHLPGTTLQFVPGEPGLPGQYRIDPTAQLTSSNLATLHHTPPGFPVPPAHSDHSPSPSSPPRTPPEDAQRFHHYWTGPPPRDNTDPGQTNDHRVRERSRSRDTRRD